MRNLYLQMRPWLPPRPCYFGSPFRVWLGWFGLSSFSMSTKLAILDRSGSGISLVGMFSSSAETRDPFEMTFADWVWMCLDVALISRRRSYLFLGGSLSSAISLFMVMRLASWMFGAREMVFQAELYLGLMVFVGYVLFDTQVSPFLPSFTFLCAWYLPRLGKCDCIRVDVYIIRPSSKALRERVFRSHGRCVHAHLQKCG